MPIPRLAAYAGPPVLSYGFRPFFLLGSIWAGLAMLVWLPMFYGEFATPTAFSPRDWHVHEMLYGYVPAVVTGFLLTAVPNWTGRLPLQGAPLLGLVLVWVAGRLAVTTSALSGWLLAAFVDCSFLLLVMAAAAREIVAGRNWRNLKVLLVVAALLAGNAAFHVEAHINGIAEHGTRIGIAAIIMLITLVGGRIIPSFTRNWLVRENPGRLPAPFDRFDAVAIVVSGVALTGWVVAPDWPVTGAALVAAGLLQAARLARWAGERTSRDRLVLVLHLAYLFVPLGFLFVGASAFGLVPGAAGIHAWAAGAVGGMTLAVMSRASLGHTGRALAASRTTQALYGFLLLAAAARICAALHPELGMVLLNLAGAAWATAFVGFAAAYWRVFTGPRASA